MWRSECSPQSTGVGVWIKASHIHNPERFRVGLRLNANFRVSLSIILINYLFILFNRLFTNSNDFSITYSVSGGLCGSLIMHCIGQKFYIHYNISLGLYFSFKSNYMVLNLPISPTMNVWLMKRGTTRAVTPVQSTLLIALGHDNLHHHHWLNGWTLHYEETFVHHCSIGVIWQGLVNLHMKRDYY